MTATDQRLIEDYIPIEAISAEARREKSIRKGHIATLHLWWARRPLVAARAAVYGALVPATVGKQKDKDTTSSFVADLCKYPGSPSVIAEARRNILEAHAARLTAERVGAGLAPAQATVTAEDIEAGRAPRPRVLDMFAGGGAIPLEALRLGCEAYALDLNPVAHLIQLCTLVYPQQYGAADPAAHGSAADGTWAGLAAEVEHWSKWVLQQVKAEIGDLYPPIPDPASLPQSKLRRVTDPPGAHNEGDPPGAGNSGGDGGQLSMDWAAPAEPRDAAKMLTPVAYLWTRTVRCKNPACGGTVPLARQTWLAKKEGHYVALQMDAETNRAKPAGEKMVRFRIVEATTEAGLGFDPAAGSRGGNVACPFCGTVADSTYVKAEGKARRISYQLMAVVSAKSSGKGKFEQGKVYLPPIAASSSAEAANQSAITRIEKLCAETGLTSPDEPIEANPRSFDIQHFGFERWEDVTTARQRLALLTFTKQIHAASAEMTKLGYSTDQATTITDYLGLTLDRLADYSSTFCTWMPEFVAHTFPQPGMPMVWDFAEANPLEASSGGWPSALDYVVTALRQISGLGAAAIVRRGSATELPWSAETFDAVVTDPPYYDSRSYSNLSDFFYVWLKRSVGPLHPEHFSAHLTPKKREAIMAFYRHGGNRETAAQAYEATMAQAFVEAKRVLKPNAPMVVVYAHKTTAGWATLIDALRIAGFTVTEAWAVEMERQTRTNAQDRSALASSIFLVTRRRESNETGSYERDVRPDLERIVRERVDRLWAQGVTGADLVIACVGAGLAAFTKYAHVEYANGAPVPADTFLAEVEGAVLETLLERLFGISRAGFSRVDPSTRFYVLWRYAYRLAAIDAGEAIVFAYPQHVELDGANGLTGGPNPLVEKGGSKYRLRDFTERGDDEKLGLPKDGRSASLVDVLHRVLWLVEHRPALIPAYLDEAQPDIEHLRVVAQTLAGQTLAGNGSGGGRSLVAARGAEAASLRKLTTNWRSLVETSTRGL